LRLTLLHRPDGASVEGPNRIVYDIEGDTAHVAPAQVRGPALVWELSDREAPAGALLSADVELDSGTPWLMRCDRVDFRPGGIAYRHVHPGPGIRYLLFGEITIETGGGRHTFLAGEPWFERGSDPVLATTTDRAPSAFARVLLLPAEWAGKRTIRYVDPADAEKPKTQQARIFLEHPVAAAT
jgi:hypothetical protein